MLSIRENEIAAESMGINALKYKMMAFVIAAFFAGLAGGLYAHYSGYIKPDLFDFNKSIDYLTFVVFGGMGSLSGSIISAIMLTFLPELLRSMGDFRMVIYPLALILLMIFRPEGLFGDKEISLKIFGKLIPRKNQMIERRLNSMLEVQNLSIVFGGLKAVSDFNLTINEKEIVGLIGPNGAGKTTVFNMLTGVYTPTEGTISYLGEKIQGLKPYNITQKKIARTFQNIRLFSHLSVLDNVKVSLTIE